MVALDACRGAEIFSELVAEIYGELVEVALAFYEYVEVFIDYAPFLVVAWQDGIDERQRGWRNAA